MDATNGRKDESRFDADVIQERPNAVLTWMASAWVMGSFLLGGDLLWSRASDGALGALSGGWVLGTLLLAGVASRYASRTRRRIVRVAVGHGNVFIGGSLAFRRGQIVFAGACATPDGLRRVVLRRRRMLRDFLRPHCFRPDVLAF